MDINQLRAFVQVARHSSFSLAAQALGFTQAGVSRQVRQMERELGFNLIGREQRPVTLTRAGREFLSCAERVLDDLENTIQIIKVGSKRLAGPINIAASTIPGEFLAPDLLARFTARYPGVRPSLLITDSAGVVDELLARRADIGFLGAALAHPKLRLVPFAEDEIILVVPAGHPLAGKGTIPLDALAGQPFVEREGGSGTLESLKRLLAQHGLALPEHQVAMIAGTSQTQLAAIEAGAGLGFVSNLALASRPHPRVVRVEIDGLRFKRTLYMAYENASLSSVGQTFIGFVNDSPH